MASKRKALPRKVVEQDKGLRKAEAAAGLDLLELRWHWTRNPDNPDRVTALVYSDSVGVSYQNIYRDGKAWEIFSTMDEKISVSEARARAGVNPVLFAAKKAVADDAGRSVVQVSPGHDQGLHEQAKKVRAVLEDVLEADPTVDIEEKAADVVSALKREWKPAETPLVKAGFTLVMMEFVSLGVKIRKVADDLSQDWSLTTEDLESIGKAWEQACEAHEALRMAVEVKQGGGVMAGVEAILKGSNQ